MLRGQRLKRRLTKTRRLFGEPELSVEVDGKCYGAWAGNYAMFGRINKLCDRTFDLGGRVGLLKAKAWKWTSYREKIDAETVGWYWAGYNGWAPGGKNPESITPYVVAATRKKWGWKPLPGGNPKVPNFTFTWWPIRDRGEDVNYTVKEIDDYNDKHKGNMRVNAIG